MPINLVPHQIHHCEVSRFLVYRLRRRQSLSTQAYIDKHLYFYRSSTTETEAQREDRVDKSRKVISEFRYSPYIRSLTR